VLPVALGVPLGLSGLVLAMRRRHGPH